MHILKRLHHEWINKKESLSQVPLLAEVEWLGFTETSKDKGHKIWFSGEDSNHSHELVFIVRK
ncbi:hypothetical protein DPMN_178978 [Dreissena polymorpha]|uniref:Uncharacterized protein n=1 Tax=Dreissena polymorpha TaxID=45954 RepID=A0A9D4IJ55_DREPO|nr:hypothetical protein DPMN_178978 [Dreissena polymorpha]